MEFSITRGGRRRRVVLAIGAATLVGGVVIGGAAAANAGQAPAPKPAGRTTARESQVIFVDCDPDLTTGDPGNGVHSHPQKPPTGSDVHSHPIKPTGGGADDPIVVAVNCPTDDPASGVHSHPMKPTGGTAPSVAAVAGKPDLSQVKIVKPQAVSVPVKP